MGWLALLILEVGAMRRPEVRDRRGRKTPTSFLCTFIMPTLGSLIGAKAIMKKLFYLGSLLAIMMVSPMSVTFTSCSDDDDEKQTNDAESIVGTWVEYQESGTNLYLVLYANGLGCFQVERRGQLEDDGYFSYTYEDGVLSLYYKESSYVEYLYVQSMMTDRLSVIWDGSRRVFYRY